MCNKLQINCKELNKELMKIKQNKNSLLIKKLEDLGIDYKILSMEDYNYLRVRVIIDDSNNDDNYTSLMNRTYAYTDIWYSKFDNGWVAKNYYHWKEK